MTEILKMKGTPQFKRFNFIIAQKTVSEASESYMENNPGRIPDI